MAGQIKQIALLKAKSGMSRRAFINRYESGHAPLVVRNVPFFREYRRNFPLVDGAVNLPRGAAGGLPNWDAITTLWFDDRGAVRALEAALGEPATGKLIAEDESALFDRGRMIMFEADEWTSALDDLASACDTDASPAVKVLGMLKRKQGLDRDAFVAEYEEVHAPRALALMRLDGMPLLSSYVRSYPVPGALFSMAHVDEPLTDPGFDVLTELTFDSISAFTAFLAVRADPHVAAQLGAGRERLFDPGVSWLFKVEEHRSDASTIAAARARKRGGQ